MLPNNKTSVIQTIYDPVKKKHIGGVDAANLINDYFSNKGPKLAVKITYTRENFWPKQAPVFFD